MKTKHTSGLWFVNFNKTTCGVAQVCADTKHYVFGIADCYKGESSEHGKRGKYVVSQAEMLANAKLIAAAPELLAALEGVVRVADRDTVEFAAARAAIARATGQT